MGLLIGAYGPDIPISIFQHADEGVHGCGNIATGIVLGGQPIFGYNYGAKKYDRVRDTYKLVLNTTLVVGIITTLIFEIYPEAIIAIFLLYLLEKSKVGTGINGILYAVPIADLVALVVILGLTVPFFSKLKK